MLLTDVVLRAVISITLTQTPAKESIYVGKIILTKDGKEYTFDFDTRAIDIIDHTVVIYTEKPADARQQVYRKNYDRNDPEYI